ncbi:NAD(P)-dependent dehydrogenase (short-subunit alcohol dehydrogenase family) [Paraburkholderia sp. GAS38]|uniref:SDR family NAD(P)-dependent oxidoreductase n=1 Tax=Paraburkholderia sp. GAS38 TaxID=3035133 RepID=UPI003D228FA9
MDLQLRNKVVVVTGPAKGMGPAIVRAFAAEGAKLVLAGRDMAAIEGLVEDPALSGADILMIRCDVTDAADADALANATMARFGCIDVLINVAGGTGPVGGTTWTTTNEEFEEIVDVNLTGCFNMMRAIMPSMIERRYGKVVNVGGTFGMRGRAGRMAYSASKWGLRGVTKSAALEAGRYNINVNYVAPGMVDGERFRTKVVPDVMRKLSIGEEEAVAHHAQDYALQRISNDSDVAHACLFLSSDVSRQITGVDLPVDGGWAML